MKKLYFICLAGRIRSKRAAELFASRFETAYFGINKYAYYHEGHNDKPEYVMIALQKKLDSAEYVFVMEKYMKDALESLIGHSSDKIVVLGIEDKYVYESQELEAILLEKISPYLKDVDDNEEHRQDK